MLINSIDPHYPMIVTIFPHPNPSLLFSQAVHAEVRRAAQGCDPTPTAGDAIGGSVKTSCRRKMGEEGWARGLHLVIYIYIYTYDISHIIYHICDSVST